MKMKGFKATAAVEVLEPVTTTALATTAELFDGNLINRWLKFLGRSQKTTETYTRALKQLLKYFSNNNITAPVRENLEDWRDSLIDSGKAAATVQLYLTTAKLFFRFLNLEGIYPNVADHLANRVRLNHEHKRGALSATQSAQLFQAVKGDSLKAKQLRAILGVALSTGCRSIELTRARIKDLRRDGNSLYLFVTGKGHFCADQRVKIGGHVHKLILQYLQARQAAGGNISGDAPLFASCARGSFDKPLSTQTLRKDTKALLRSIGIDDKAFSFHSLRHTAAMNMLRGFTTPNGQEVKGCDLLSLKMVLRHSSLAVSQIYVDHFEREKNNAEFIAEAALFGALDTLGAQTPNNAYCV